MPHYSDDEQQNRVEMVLRGNIYEARNICNDLHELVRLRAAVRRTIDENLHLADGDVCTLIHLKRALQPNA